MMTSVPPNIRLYGNIVAFLAVSGGLGLVVPLSVLASSKTVDALVEGKSLAIPLLWVGAIAGLYLLLEFIAQNVFVWLETRGRHLLQAASLHKFSRIDYSLLEDPDRRNMWHVVREEALPKPFKAVRILGDIIGLLVQIVGMVLILLPLSVVLSITYVVMMAVSVAMAAWGMHRMNTMFDGGTRDERFLSSYEAVLLSRDGVHELRSLGALGFLHGRFQEFSDRVLRRRTIGTIKAQQQTALSSLALIGWFVVALLVLTQDYSSGRISLGSFVALMGSLAVAMGAAESMAVAASQLWRDARPLGFLRRFLALPEMHSVPTSPIPVPGSPALEFSNVTFTYPGNSDPTITDLSFRVNQGESVGIVGVNGCGKSTILSLITGTYLPDTGSVRIFGVDVTEFAHHTSPWACPVFQQPVEYHRSVAENLHLSMPDQPFDEARARDALLAVGLDELAEDLTRMLGNSSSEGQGLSGGQWQRLAIARALYSDAPLSVLDEPTASLDPIAEAELFGHVQSLLGAQTSVFVSHRMESVVRTDRVLVIDDGRLVEEGCPRLLRQQDGRFQRLWLAQADWYSQKGATDGV